jgi:hypothetical protein
MSKKSPLNMTEEVKQGIEDQLSKTEKDIAIATFYNQGRDLRSAVTVSCTVCVRNVKSGTYVDAIQSMAGSSTYQGATGPLAEEPDHSPLAIACDLASLATKVMQYVRGEQFAVHAAASIQRAGEIGGQMIFVVAYVDEAGNLALRTERPQQK